MESSSVPNAIGDTLDEIECRPAKIITEIIERMSVPESVAINTGKNYSVLLQPVY